MPAQFILQKSKDGQFYFSLTAANNQKILASERYKSKDGAKNGIESVKENASNDSRYERLTAKDGQFYFTLRAANNQVIGRSEMYTSKQAMDNGIEAVKKAAASAALDDRT